jgi:hypothetical protein
MTSVGADGLPVPGGWPACSLIIVYVLKKATHGDSKPETIVRESC